MFGAQDARWVWVKGDGQGLAAQKVCARDHLRDHSLVAQMHSVEVADGGNDRGGRYS